MIENVILMVDWIDSETHLDAAWSDRESVMAYIDDEFEPCRTVGFLVGESPHCIVLALSVSSEEIGPHIKIPSMNIINRVELRAARE